MSDNLDILVFAAHPDDAELGCSGTIAREVAAGKKVGIVDLTKGEMGTRGNPELRMKEANASANILGLTARENLGFKDCRFTTDESHIVEVVKMIRKYQPRVVLANATEDRHPDHGRGAQLIEEAVFWSGLIKCETNQKPWRPERIYHYIQDRWIKPDMVVDITPYYDKKIDSIKAYKSQFYDPNSNEPESYISSRDFWDFIEARAREMGHLIGSTFGEGFTCNNPIELKQLT